MGGDEWKRNLKLCPQNKLESLVHGVIDEICGRPVHQYKDFSETWDLEQWWSVRDGLKSVCTETIKTGATKEKIRDSLQGLDAEYTDIVGDALLTRTTELRQAALRATSLISSSSLTDFHWKVKLVMASDKLANINEPMMSLDLNIQNGNSSECVSLELSKTELGDLIASLEAAAKVVHQLQS